jgi:hypothetical protein
MTTEVVDKKHAVLGPSGWHTWGSCPGSVPLSEGIVVPTSSYAKEGTAAHALLEHCLTTGDDAEAMLGHEYVIEGEAFAVDNEMADAVNSSVDVVRSLIKVEDGDILFVEQMVPLTFMTGEEDAEGTADVVGLTEGGTKLVVIDFKYGKGVQVYASDFAPDETAKKPNGQLGMYALGWLHKHGALYEDVTHAKLVVLQPRLEWVDEHDVTIEQLRDFEGAVREAAGQVELNQQVYSEGNELDLNPSEKACKFCKAKAICPALKAVVSDSMALVAEPSKAEEFADLTIPKQAAAVNVNPDVSNEKLAEFVRAIPLIEEAVKAARAEVERRLFAGQQVPGFYLGVGRKGKRQWVDSETALQELTRSGRLKMMEALERKPISPTTAEKLLKDRPKIWAKIAPFITQPEGKPSVCREGLDNNPVYQIVSDVSEFANLDALPAPVYDAAAMLD